MAMHCCQDPYYYGKFIGSGRLYLFILKKYPNE